MKTAICFKDKHSQPCKFNLITALYSPYRQITGVNGKNVPSKVSFAVWSVKIQIIRLHYSSFSHDNQNTFLFFTNASVCKSPRIWLLNFSHDDVLKRENFNDVLIWKLLKILYYLLQTLYPFSVGFMAIKDTSLTWLDGDERKVWDFLLCRCVINSRLKVSSLGAGVKLK